MIAPFWQQISQWAPFSVDFMKPNQLCDKQIIKKEIDEFQKLQTSKISGEFETIVQCLPKEDDDPMTIALYPSDNDMPEGIVGTGVWGNIILNINPLNPCFETWTPFVFAHEYHHNVLGFYWYCVKEGKETKGNFLEAIINEGEADAFAQSIYPSLSPSWHKGVSADRESEVWEKLKKVLYKESSPEEISPYMFGNEDLGIPANSGYYFGHAIVEDYINKHYGISFQELIKVPHKDIFNESRFAK